MTRHLPIVGDTTNRTSPVLRISAIVLAVGVLAAPIAGRVQSPQGGPTRATVRHLATLEGDVNGFVRLPSGRALIYSVTNRHAFEPRVEDSTFAYDIATRKSTLLGTNMLPASVSASGDRLAFSRSSEDRTGNLLWTMPIDPETGIATGQAQRVSLRPMTRGGAFSHDGRMLVFLSGPRPDDTWDLVLVPARGGAERVVATYPGYVVTSAWSADGQWLYVERGPVPPFWCSGSGDSAVVRVPVAGGRSDPLVPYPTTGQPVGLSPDERVAFLQANPDRWFYRTASGLEGEISVSVPSLDDGMGINLTLDRWMRYLTMTQDRIEHVRVVDVATGEARDLLPGAAQSSTPAWSPDGRRIAVLSGNLSHYDITVVNADGSSPRHYPVPVHLNGWFGQSPDTLVWENPWSPDGRFLAFRANLAKHGEKVGWSLEDKHQIGLLDVHSGETRVLITSSSQIGGFKWRSDGNAIRAVEFALTSTGSPARLSVIEIPLTGPTRTLREISAEFPVVNDVAFFSDHAVVVAAVTGARATERFLVPLDGSATRRLPDPGTETGLRAGQLRVAGTRILYTLLDERDEAQFIKVVSTVDDSTRTLRLPFSGRSTVVFPDGEQVVSLRKASPNPLWELFLLPLDGSTPRRVAEIPLELSSIGGVLAPSPDGKSIAYSSHGPYVSTILEIDFAPTYEAIMSRSMPLAARPSP